MSVKAYQPEAGIVSADQAELYQGMVDMFDTVGAALETSRVEVTLDMELGTTCDGSQDDLAPDNKLELYAYGDNAASEFSVRSDDRGSRFTTTSRLSETVASHVRETEPLREPNKAVSVAATAEALRAVCIGARALGPITEASRQVYDGISRVARDPDHFYASTRSIVPAFGGVMQVAAAGLRRVMPGASAEVRTRLSGSAELGLRGYGRIYGIELHTASENDMVSGEFWLVIGNFGAETMASVSCQARITDREAKRAAAYSLLSNDNYLWQSSRLTTTGNHHRHTDNLTPATPADIVRMARLVMGVATDDLEAVR